MRIRDNLRRGRRLYIQYLAATYVFTLTYVLLEYYFSNRLGDNLALVPLLIRAFIVSTLIALSGATFELFFFSTLTGKSFGRTLVYRAVGYTLMMAFWLIPINAIWLMMAKDVTFAEGAVDYIIDDAFRLNMTVIFIFIVVMVSGTQINSLHKRGALRRYILGVYNQPREVRHVFCFIDLKDSTSIAEKLGHRKFAAFLKDYYSDISFAIEDCKAEVYQYVGDEVVLIWNFSDAIANANCLHCCFMMKEAIGRVRDKYDREYGVIPDFRAGLHGGDVMVTWVGNFRKEIVYIGDVLNTAKRIQEACKQYRSDFLASGAIIREIREKDDFSVTEVGQFTPRGKSLPVQLYSVEHAGQVF